MSRAGAAELIRKQLLAALAGSVDPVTTAVLRDRLTADAGPVVNETVYRNLIVLEQRGLVRRLRLGGRHVAWQRTDTEERATP